jgi:hypothetical protein
MKSRRLLAEHSGAEFLLISHRAGDSSIEQRQVVPRPPPSLAFEFANCIIDIQNKNLSRYVHPQPFAKNFYIWNSIKCS